jgi:hypothetical protein
MNSRRPGQHIQPVIKCDIKREKVTHESESAVLKKVALASMIDTVLFFPFSLDHCGGPTRRADNFGFRPRANVRGGGCLAKLGRENFTRLTGSLVDRQGDVEHRSVF